jgi:hypothetical protein
MNTGRVHQKQLEFCSGAATETRIGRGAGAAAAGRTTFMRLTGCRMTGPGAAWGAAKIESNHNQPVSACAVPERHMNDATATTSAAGLANCPKAVIGKLLSPSPTKPDLGTILVRARLSCQKVRSKLTRSPPEGSRHPFGASEASRAHPSRCIAPKKRPPREGRHVAGVKHQYGSSWSGEAATRAFGQ